MEKDFWMLSSPILGTAPKKAKFSAEETPILVGLLQSFFIYYISFLDLRSFIP